jgi:hypothetical protein
MPVQVVTDRGLDAEDRRGLGPSTQEREERLGDAQREREQSEGEQGAAVAVGHGAIDDLLSNEGRDDRGPDPGDGGQPYKDQGDEVRTKVRFQSP